MCGIAGSVNFNLSKDRAIRDLFHRGPDEYGFFEEENVSLIHTRLAIQDISYGSQPLSLGELVIVFNGEIYNHLELRKSFLKDCKFRTNSDTETLLLLYDRFKENLFNLIDGMYAFCIYDKKKKRLFLARDRSGKKPLYYFFNGSIFVFASELNVIKNQLSLEIDDDALKFFLRTGFFWRNTPFKKVYELEPGTYMELDIKTLELRKYKYFSIRELYSKNKSRVYDENEAIRLVKDSFEKSVYNRLISSDVEVSAFLSGGIDSSLVVAFASKYASIQTFTVKMEGMYDESEVASRIAKHLNIPNELIKINLDTLREDIEEILLAYGKPFFDSSAIPSYYISKETSKYTKVVLNGDGGDELFAGYRRYIPFQWPKILNILKRLQKICTILPPPKTKASLYNFFYRLIRASGKTGISLYLNLTTDIFEDVLELKNEYIEHLDSYICEVLNMQELDFVQKLLILDFDIILPSDLLQKMDIATMKNSLEARSPFLSKYMIETATRLDTSLKVRGGTTKLILRKLAEQYIPKEITKLPKKGFEVPLSKWIDNDLNDIIRHYVFEKPRFYIEFVPKTLVQQIYERRINIPEDKRAKILWTTFTLEVWGQNL